MGRAEPERPLADTSHITLFRNLMNAVIASDRAALAASFADLAVLTLFRRLYVSKRKQEREVVGDLQHAADDERQSRKRRRQEGAGERRTNRRCQAARNRCHARG